MGRLELVREPLAEIADSLDWILANKRQWLERTRNKAPWLSSGRADVFLRQWQRHPDAGPGSMWTLRIDGKIVAASLVFEERIVWTAHIIAHDTSINQYSPGRTLNLMIIERAFEEAGVMRVEFGMSGDHWKERITRHRELVLSKRFRLK
jgi:CelD/BcsL family acetyltransferase involved in cellulose biosynthesis